MIQFNSKFNFGTKAETLKRISSLLPKGTVPDYIYFSRDEWLISSDEILKKVENKFTDKLIIIRSSSFDEDGVTSANAGAFLSVPDVEASDTGSVRQAVGEVIESYHKVGSESHNSFDQILIQRMVSSVQMSGVIFTQDLTTGAPYYVINYDDESGSTDSVTGGNYNNRTLYVHRAAYKEVTSPRFLTLLEMVKNIESITDETCLDIEFAIDVNGNVRIFQVRRITTQPNWNRGVELQVNDAIARIRELIEMRYCRNTEENNPYIDTVLGQMPDWNPAEMIGTAPRPLAISLYRHLITDSTWRTARKEMGYVEHAGMPLMVSFMGKPFIDTRESFYSYFPVDLDESIQDKLVDIWIKNLRKNHHLHDKVEFEIATTTFSLSFDEKVAELFPNVLSEAELNKYRGLLKIQTERHITGKLGDIDSQLNRLSELKKRRKHIIDKASTASLEIISALIDDAISFGTLPFAILARHGFIAASFLRSMVEKKIISRDELEAFQMSISTVASEFLVDLENIGESSADFKQFKKKYGHLRPGTYDILSLRYDERYLNRPLDNSCKKTIARLRGGDFSESTMARINSALVNEGFEFDAKILLNYIRRAIKWREYAKFEFTHNLSNALEVLSAWGQKYGLSREELSYIEYSKIMDTLTTTHGRSIESYLRSESEQGSRFYDVTTAIKLPSLITRISDLYIVPLAIDSPSFITRKNICEKVVLVTGTTQGLEILKNKIVLIESADPGYDWIFACSIAGLITKFGGTNSHMAIRCAEFDLPAAIGCGEQLFDRAKNSKEIELLCAEGIIKFL